MATKGKMSKVFSVALKEKLQLVSEAPGISKV